MRVDRNATLIIRQAMNLSLFRLEVKKFEKQGVPCKGRFFRCIINNYLSHDGGYVEQIRMKPLKRMSCKGCADCEHIDVGMQEQMDNDVPLIIENPVHGGTFRVDIGNIGTDWESGYVDEWDYIFTIVKD